MENIQRSHGPLMIKSHTSEIADRVKLLQYSQQLCWRKALDARASSKRAFDVKAKFKQFKIKDEVLLYLPSPPKGHNSKFHTPLRGVYTVVEKTSPLTYIVRKKGGRNKRLEIWPWRSQNSDFQSQFSMSKIIRIIPNFLFLLKNMKYGAKLSLMTLFV